MTWIEQSVSYNSEKWKRDLAKIVYDELKKTTHEKEATNMQVSYNGFTGELLKLERKATQIFSYKPDGEMQAKTFFVEPGFNLVIYDEGKGEIRAFSDVKLEDVKFFGGAVSFGG